MAEQRFLVVRLGSLGDIVFTIPAVAALRAAFPEARIDWLVDRRWIALVEGNPHLTKIIALPDRSVKTYLGCAKGLRENLYTCAIDIQALYKSAALAWLSRAPRRIGFTRNFVRESGAALFYTERIAPNAPHMVGQNMALAVAAGAREIPAEFPLHIAPEASQKVESLLEPLSGKPFVVLSPGGGWKSKCWPAERFGHLAARLSVERSFRCLVNSGPGEERLAEAAVAASEGTLTLLPKMSLDVLMALLQRAMLVVAADSGPLHLAVALKTPVVGLFGPTDPARNGPYCKEDIVVRNASESDTTYKRRDEYSAAMLSIGVQQVLDAIEKRLAVANRR